MLGWRYSSLHTSQSSHYWCSVGVIPRCIPHSQAIIGARLALFLAAYLTVKPLLVLGWRYSSLHTSQSSHYWCSVGVIPRCIPHSQAIIGARLALFLAAYRTVKPLLVLGWRYSSLHTAVKPLLVLGWRYSSLHTSQSSHYWRSVGVIPRCIPQSSHYWCSVGVIPRCIPHSQAIIGARLALFLAAYRSQAIIGARLALFLAAYRSQTIIGARLALFLAAYLTVKPLLVLGWRYSSLHTSQSSHYWCSVGVIPRCIPQSQAIIGTRLALFPRCSIYLN